MAKAHNSPTKKTSAGDGAGRHIPAQGESPASDFSGPVSDDGHKFQLTLRDPAYTIHVQRARHKGLSLQEYLREVLGKLAQDPEMR